ncbi:MAG: hypothetical protein RLZ14_2005, partial [Actinomycetota bacterium]
MSQREPLTDEVTMQLRTAVLRH